MELILVRHTSVAVAKGTCYGWTDVALSDTFEQEATLTRTALLAYAPFDAAYSSRLVAPHASLPFVASKTPPSTHDYAKCTWAIGRCNVSTK